MALLIWMPLNGNINNYGLVNYGITSTGVTYSASGKTGLSYIRATSSAQTTNGITIQSNLVEDIGSAFSISVWVKPYGTHTHYNGTVFSSGNWNTSNGRYAFGVSQDNTKVDVLGIGHNKYINCNVPVNQWTHLVSTQKDKAAKLYKNGTYVGQYGLTTNILSSDTTSVCIGRETYANGYFGFNGEICDLRVFNHCLSDKEIREIANGLILNYRFSSPLTDASSNLVRNGFGNLGYENWANTNASTDVPSASTATKSFYNNNTTEGIPIVPDHQYTLSGYVKRYGTTTTASRMSIIPYDADKLRIQNYHSNGFLTATTTTLAKDLNSGDTVVYVTSAANWVTSGSNSEFIAIFGYTDGSGYVWPDMVYTRYCYYITKESINKTNNTIPLTSAYNGPKRLKGTTVCQSTAGSTYYYPRTVGTAYTQDWYYYTISFVPKDVQYIKAAKYFLIAAISSTMMAAITLKDDNAQNLICDSSGLQNNGQIVGTGNTGILSGGARGDFSLYIEDGRTNCVKANLKMPLYAITMSCWFKSTNTSPYGSFHILMATGTQYEMDVSGSGNFRSGFAINGVRTVSDYGSGNLLDGKWHMLTHSFDGTTIKRYIDGVEVNSTSKSGTLDGRVLDLYIGRFGTQTGYGITKGYVSDVRIYATALSAEQVKELYNVGGSVDNKGNVFTYELKEN